MHTTRPISIILRTPLFVVGLCLSLTCQSPSKEVPHNIILFIGDGMGTAHMSASHTMADTSHLARLSAGGFLSTQSADDYITDSAASATALATGIKTTNGTVSMTPAGDTLRTVLEAAEALGMSTGLVVTSSVTHATPACFASHVDQRSKHQEIARQIAGSEVDVLFGGGLGYFLPVGTGSSLRHDEMDLIATLSETHSITLMQEDFNKIPTDKPAVALLSRDEMPPANQQTVTLARMTRKALEILRRNPRGFFLLVEGSQIDWAAHDNLFDPLVDEMLDFNDAVGVGLDFAEQDGETLVIVTADHETGGLSLLDGSITEGTVSKYTFATTSHTGTMVPLLAFGPAASTFGGIHDNTHVGRLMLNWFER